MKPYFGSNSYFNYFLYKKYAPNRNFESMLIALHINGRSSSLGICFDFGFVFCYTGFVY